MNLKYQLSKSPATAGEDKPNNKIIKPIFISVENNDLDALPLDCLPKDLA